VVVAGDEEVDGVNAERAELGQDSYSTTRVDQSCLATFTYEDGIGLADV
jgi:hypothetical protein